jgi:gpW
MATLTPAARLAAAEDALHRLTTGQAVREVFDSDGSRVVYFATDIPLLKGQIESLRREVAGQVSSRRPMGVWF